MWKRGVKDTFILFLKFYLLIPWPRIWIRTKLSQFLLLGCLVYFSEECTHCKSGYGPDGVYGGWAVARIRVQDKGGTEGGRRGGTGERRLDFKFWCHWRWCLSGKWYSIPIIQQQSKLKKWLSALHHQCMMSLYGLYEVCCPWCCPYMVSMSDVVPNPYGLYEACCPYMIPLRYVVPMSLLALRTPARRPLCGSAFEMPGSGKFDPHTIGKSQYRRSRISIWHTRFLL